MRIPGIADRPVEFIDSLVAAPGAAPGATDPLRSRPGWRDRFRRKPRDRREDEDTVTLHEGAAYDEEPEETGLYSGPAASGYSRRRPVP